MANYTTAAKISQFLQRSLTLNETASLAYILPAVDKWINRRLESRFDEVEPSTRYFDGGGHSVDIDPVQDVTAVGSVNNDNSASYDYTLNDEYVLEPANETVKTEIVHRGRRSRYPRGLTRVAVTGRFTEYDYENDTVPAEIIMAATRLAAGILNAGQTAGQGGNIASESLEGHTVNYDVTSTSIEALSAGDPIIQGMLGGRREIFIETGDSDRYGYDELEDY